MAGTSSESSRNALLNRISKALSQCMKYVFFPRVNSGPHKRRLNLSLPGVSACARPRIKDAGRSENKTTQAGHKPMSLKKLAEYLGLPPAAVSPVINRSTVADSIPQETKDRVFAAARKFKYRPNFFARSLRAQRSSTIGVMKLEVNFLALWTKDLRELP